MKKTLKCTSLSRLGKKVFQKSTKGNHVENMQKGLNKVGMPRHSPTRKEGLQKKNNFKGLNDVDFNKTKGEVLDHCHWTVKYRWASILQFA